MLGLVPTYAVVPLPSALVTFQSCPCAPCALPSKSKKVQTNPLRSRISIVPGLLPASGVALPRRGLQATIRFVDAADLQPIEGVSIKLWAKEFVSDREGVIIIDLPDEHETFVGLDEFARVSIKDSTMLRKHDERVNTERLVIPRFVRFPLASQPLGVPLEVTVPLNFDGVMVRGTVNVDASSANLTDRHRKMLPGKTLLRADLSYYGGFTLAPPIQEIVLGPLPQGVKRGYVQAVRDFFPVDIGENFDIRVVLERKIAIVRVELPDALQLIRVAQRYACYEVTGATLFRITDGHVFSAETYPRHTYGSTDVYVPPGKFVVLPGTFADCSFSLAVGQAIDAGIDVTQFGLTIVEVVKPENADGELPKITVQASVIDSIRAIERIQQELDKRKATNEPPVAPAGDPAAQAPRPK